MRVVAAMSGGVDSSVTAALLKEQGHEVIGVHMKLHDVPATGGGKHCCGLDDALDARRVAGQLGIPFYVMDLQAEFRTAVVDYFADTYLSGATPIPCVPCNGVLKFKVLLQRAKALGASHLATGHYARVTEGGGLLAAIDRKKDQTYFLFPVQRQALRQTMLPLGVLHKEQVREHARRLGLATAEKHESQEICFIPDDDHTRFVRQHRPDADGSGEIVDVEGRVLGRHDGYWRFTVGQRRGVGVAVGHPIYVLEIDPVTRRVVIGGEDRLMHRWLVARGVNWFRQPEAGEAVTARIRHKSPAIPCTVEGADPLTVRFADPARAATPGQAVVLYAGDEVLAGGWITEVGQ